MAAAARVVTDRTAPLGGTATRGRSDMTELERRYSSLLRLYPAAYRRVRGAEMLAALMDSCRWCRSG